MREPLPSIQIFCPNCGHENLILGTIPSRPMRINCARCETQLSPPVTPGAGGDSDPSGAA